MLPGPVLPGPRDRRPAGSGGGCTRSTPLGLPGRRPLALLGFAPVAPASPAETPADDLLVRLAAASARHWPAVHAEASVATVGRTVYVLLPLDEGVAAFATARRLGEQAAAVLDRSVETPLRAACSRIATGPEELPDLRAEVDDVLRVTTADPQAPAFATLRDTHARVLLAHVGDELARRPRLRHPGIEAMLEHDRARGTAFAASVTAWLDAIGNIGDAAARLTIHPNTLKYRLRRAGELFGVDLDHPDDRLSCWLQLRLPR
ncbi:sugar diacid utilization regulator [Streptacidiphilus sp. MAP12-33]|uniref:PucR family transcriptional regulator n=1 Tax=Streptacidiphilus sp. MAP12-33 TaxID=3156266 RepID=UPI0035137EBB